MRKILEDMKAIIAELIGMIGGFFWARSTNWDYEPLIILTTSSLLFLVSLLLIIFKNRKYDTKEISSVDLSSETPITIKKKISSSPLYQKDDIAKHYIGLFVEWNLSLFVIHKGLSSSITVSMLSNNEIYPSIKFNTNTDLYPIFKIAEKNKNFKVKGKIINCDEFSIELNLIELKEI